MTLENANLKVGRKCQLVNSSGTFVDGNVTEDDVTSFQNDRCRQLYLKLIDKYPFLGQYEESIDLVEDQEFYSFGDLTEDLLVPGFVGIKYTSTDEDYTRVLRRERNRLFKTSTSKTNYDKSKPWYTFSRDTSGNLGIKLTPTPDAAVTDGLYFEYVILPDDLSSSGETFITPELLQDVQIAYVIADVWEAKRDWSNSNQALNRALLLEREFFENYNPKTSDTPARFSIGKTFNPFNK
jgi:hypothetical protein